MRTLLVFDVETTGLDPTIDRVIEVGYCLWSVEYRSVLETYSTLFTSEVDNKASPFNGIPMELLLTAPILDQAYPVACAMVLEAASRADAVIAHQADFDREFSERGGFAFAGKPWICSREDVVWPRSSPRQSLIDTALANGVAVTGAHRAMTDVMLIVRLLESVPDVMIRNMLESALKSAQKPKAHFIAQIAMEQNDEAKKRGFRWNGACWTRYMAIEDAAQLPFTVVQEQSA